jgi:hypothetical protein
MIVVNGNSTETNPNARVGLKSSLLRALFNPELNSRGISHTNVEEDIIQQALCSKTKILNLSNIDLRIISRNVSEESAENAELAGYVLVI